MTKKASSTTLFRLPGNVKSVAHDVPNVIAHVENVIDDAFFLNADAFHVASNLDTPHR
ncbi:MAG: hypothetical protein ACRDRQ_20395 [Pseudonocardiaceae bacterium]